MKKVPSEMKKKYIAWLIQSAHHKTGILMRSLANDTTVLKMHEKSDKTNFRENTQSETAQIHNLKFINLKKTWKEVIFP